MIQLFYKQHAECLPRNTSAMCFTNGFGDVFLGFWRRFVEQLVAVLDPFLNGVALHQKVVIDRFGNDGIFLVIRVTLNVIPGETSERLKLACKATTAKIRRTQRKKKLKKAGTNEIKTGGSFGNQTKVLLDGAHCIDIDVDRGQKIHGKRN